jgi:hypothetical protein
MTDVVVALAQLRDRSSRPLVAALPPAVWHRASTLGRGAAERRYALARLTHAAGATRSGGRSPLAAASDLLYSRED